VQESLEYDVGIAGAGMLGASTAYHLALRGVSVVVFDKQAMGTEASGRCGGGVRQQNRHPAELPLSIESVKFWKQIPEIFGEDVEYVQQGNIRIALQPEDLLQMKEDVVRQGKAGLEVHLLTVDETVKIAPCINRKKIVGSTFCPTDGHANPILAAKAFGRAARRAGATIREFEPVTGLRPERRHICVDTPQATYRVGKFLNAAGSWSPQIGSMMGIRLPVRIEASTIAVTERTAPLYSQFIYREGFGYTRQAKNGNIHLGSHIYRALDRYDRRVPFEVFPRYVRLSQLIPVIRELNIIRTWTGFTTWTSDKTAIIDRVPDEPRYYILTGLSGHGFCIAPALGHLTAEFMMGHTPPFDMSAFRLNRF
jgi:sarcosine oxidase subunit beta